LADAASGRMRHDSAARLVISDARQAIKSVGGELD
jgi:hypothetical protein